MPHLLVFFITLYCTLAVTSCTPGPKRESMRTHGTPGRSIPAYIHKPEEQLEYLLEHYWDNVSLEDSAWPQLESSLHIQLLDYFSLLDSREHTSRRLFLQPLIRAKGRTSSAAEAVYERYYGDAKSSPLFRDCYHQYLLYWQMTSAQQDASKRSLAQKRLREYRMNAVGSIAKDFAFHTDSTWTTLHRQGSAPLRLLVFTEPEQTNTAEMLAHITEQPIVQKLTQQGRLDLLLMYLGSAPSLSPRDSLLPEWIHIGMAPTDSIQWHQLYTFKHMPTLYLLDNHSKVLLKEPTLEEVTQYLDNL